MKSVCAYTVAQAYAFYITYIITIASLSKGAFTQDHSRRLATQASGRLRHLLRISKPMKPIINFV